MNEIKMDFDDCTLWLNDKKIEVDECNKILNDILKENHQLKLKLEENTQIYLKTQKWGSNLEDELGKVNMSNELMFDKLKYLDKQRDEAIKYIDEILNNSEAIRYLDNGEWEYKDCVFEDYQITELVSILERKEG